jgi:hypothetical protein
VYDSELDAAQRVLTLASEGPTMSGEGKMAKYKDEIEFKSDDHRVLRNYFWKKTSKNLLGNNHRSRNPARKFNFIGDDQSSRQD